MHDQDAIEIYKTYTRLLKDEPVGQIETLDIGGTFLIFVKASETQVNIKMSSTNG